MRQCSWRNPSSVSIPPQNGVGSIAQSLALNSALKQLILRDNKIGPGGLDVLSEVLKINHGLTSLDLGSNPLGSASTALERLKDALAINKSLKELSFSSVGLSSEACVTLAEALPLSSLSRLDLTFNPIDVAGMMAIAASLKANSTITDVEVVPVLKQARDGGGRLVEVGCGDSDQCEIESTGFYNPLSQHYPFRRTRNSLACSTKSPHSVKRRRSRSRRKKTPKPRNSRIRDGLRRTLSARKKRRKKGR